MKHPQSPLHIKQPHKKNRRFVIIIVALLIVVAVIIYVVYAQLAKLNTMKLQKATFDESGVSVKPVTSSEFDSYKVQSNYPRILTIPSLGIKARMTQLGVLAPKNGAQQLDVPKNVYDTGWYDCTVNPVVANRCSTKKLPNDGNTAVANLVDGHSCAGYSVQCVFTKLPQLQVGATITVELGDGDKLNYIVKEVDVVSLSQVDMSKMMKPIESGKEGLNLITCTGSWTTKDSRGKATMDQRVEVYALKE